MLNAKIVKFVPKRVERNPSTSEKFYMSFKDGVAMEHNLTEAEAAHYRGTDIKVVAQRSFHERPVFVKGIRVGRA